MEKTDFVTNSNVNLVLDEMKKKKNNDDARQN
jgi:hypothetical protein